MPLGTGGNAAGRGGQSQHRPSTGRHGRPAQKGTGAIAHGDADKLLWAWGAPQSRKTLWGEEAQRSGRILGHFVPK